MAANQMALDPNIWDNPDEFHGFWFAELRSASKQMPTNANLPPQVLQTPCIDPWTFL